MRVGLALASLAVLLALAAGAQASHAPDTLPKTHEDPALDDALAWLADRVDDDGCALDVEDTCNVALSKWYTLAAAHAGEDPAAWPTPDASVLGYLQAHADDLRDPAVKTCDENGDSCPSDRAFSLAKSVLAFRAAGEDPRTVPTPDGGERDLVAELLDTHGLDEFGRSDRANDDVWALTALDSVGYEGPEVDDAIARVEQAQTPDGGVRHTEGQLPGVDTTAAAVWALAPHDREETVDAALGFLEDEQVESGDGKACWRMRSTGYGTTANAASTAWAINALVAVREDPVAWSVGDRTPLDCLLAHQDEAGGFRHTQDSGAQRLPTYQAAVALAWAPYGALDAPASPLTLDEEATRGRETTTRVPGGAVRAAWDATSGHTWTPQETGERVFHGFAWDPARPATVTVHVDEPEETDEASPDEDAPATPSVRVEDASAERNVPLEVTVNATAGDAPVVELAVDWGDGNATGWRASPTFTHAYAALGNHTVTAKARDADGRVADATATVTVRDAAPRITVDAPALVNRTEPFAVRADASDPDGPAPAVTWSAPGDSAEGAAATLALEAPGNRTVTATARDAAGNEAAASATVHARNRPPTVDAVTPGTLPANDTATLHADASDPDGDRVALAWTPPGADAPTTWGGQHHVDTGAPGTLTFALNASDGHGGWTRATVEVRVAEDPDDEAPAPVTVDARTEPPAPTHDPAPEPAPDQPPTVELPATVRAPANATHLVEGTVNASGGDVVRVEVALGGALPVHGDGPFTAMLPELPPGTYTLTARAIPDRGPAGPATNATVVVEPSDGGAGEPIAPAEADDAPGAREAPGVGALVAAAALLAAGGRDP